MTATQPLLTVAPTPRVDAAERFMHSANRTPVGFVLSEVARQLERELAVAMDVAYGRATVQDLEAIQQGVVVRPAPRPMATRSAFKPVPKPQRPAPSGAPDDGEESSQPRVRQKVSADGAGDKKTYEPGQVLFHKGDKADHLAIIMEGQVEIFDATDNKTIATLGAGASFGEQAILEGGVRGASARAFDKVVCLEINTAPLRAILKSDPGILTPIVESMLLQLNMANKLAKLDKSPDQVIAYEVISESRMSTTQLQNLLLEIYNTGDNKGLSSEGLMFLKLQASDKLTTSVQAQGQVLGSLNEDNFASAYIVVDGQVDAESEVYKYTLGPGSVLGLAEGVTDTPLKWTLTALNQVTLMSISIDKVLRGLDHANPGIRGIVRYTADRVLELQKKM